MNGRKTNVKDEDNNRDSYKLELVGLPVQSDRPKMAVIVVDAKNAVLHKQEIGSGGDFTPFPPACSSERTL